MPRGDGTGPAGMGPMTGRAAGYCAGHAMPGFAGSPGGRGMAWGRGCGGGGRGGGGGWRHQHWATGMPGWMHAGWSGAAPFGAGPKPEMEKQVLENQLAALQAQLDAVRKRLDEVSAQTEEKTP